MLPFVSIIKTKSKPCAYRGYCACHAEVCHFSEKLYELIEKVKKFFPERRLMATPFTHIKRALLSLKTDNVSSNWAGGQNRHALIHHIFF